MGERLAFQCKLERPLSPFSSCGWAAGSILNRRRESEMEIPDFL
jgi:hypothetical protein